MGWNSSEWASSPHSVFIQRASLKLVWKCPAVSKFSASSFCIRFFFSDFPSMPKYVLHSFYKTTTVRAFRSQYRSFLPLLWKLVPSLETPSEPIGKKESCDENWAMMAVFPGDQCLCFTSCWCNTGCYAINSALTCVKNNLTEDR